MKKIKSLVKIVQYQMITLVAVIMFSAVPKCNIEVGNPDSPMMGHRPHAQLNFSLNSSTTCPIESCRDYIVITNIDENNTTTGVLLLSKFDFTMTEITSASLGTLHSQVQTVTLDSKSQNIVQLNYLGNLPDDLSIKLSSAETQADQTQSTAESTGGQAYTLNGYWFEGNPETGFKGGTEIKIAEAESISIKLLTSQAAGDTSSNHEEEQQINEYDVSFNTDGWLTFAEKQDQPQRLARNTAIAPNSNSPWSDTQLQKIKNNIAGSATIKPGKGKGQGNNETRGKRNDSNAAPTDRPNNGPPNENAGSQKKD